MTKYDKFIDVVVDLTLEQKVCPEGYRWCMHMKKCVPAGEEKGMGQQKGRGMGDGPMGKPITTSKQEMFAADFPDIEKVEKKVDMLVDSSVTECGFGGDTNAVQNTPSDDATEELDRVHDDIAGYGDPEDIADEYSGGGDELDDADDNHVASQLESIFVNEKGEYQAFFKRMMDQEGITSIGQLSHDEKSAFFSKISAGWKKEKGESVTESFLNESGLATVAAILGASALILGPHFARLRKQKKVAKGKCAKFSGVENKKCLLRVEQEIVKKQLAAMKKAQSKCSQHKNPAKCKQRLQGVFRDFENKIREYDSKIKAL